MELKRSLEQWAKCEPRAMSMQSEAALTYAFADAKADIATMASRVEAIEAKCAMLSASLKQADALGVELQAALHDCVLVMERDLNGLAVIQPELRQARAALAKGAVFVRNPAGADWAARSSGPQPASVTFVDMPAPGLL